MAIKSTWFFVPKEQRTARLRLVCFPPAGMGAAFFRSWSSELPETVEICAVQLPGSLPRFDEPPMGSIPELAQAIASELPQTPQLQLALFGHSMGAVLASEVARNLAVRSGLLPRLLIVSGRRPPKVPDTLPPISGLPDGAFRRGNQPALQWYSGRNLGQPRRSRVVAAGSARRLGGDRDFPTRTETANSNSDCRLRWRVQIRRRPTGKWRSGERRRRHLFSRIFFPVVTST